MTKLLSCPLFEGITYEEFDRIYTCFGMTEQDFKTDEQIYDFAEGRRLVGFLHSGSAVIERIDAQGSRTILEHLHPGSVFGEILMFENVAGDCITVVCETPCSVCFMPETALKRRCENACEHHSRLVENMFSLMTEKASALSERVEVLSRRSIRDKLLCYFRMQAAKGSGESFMLPFSLSALADYISADRSAMMRELKKLREETLVSVTGRQVTLSL